MTKQEADERDQTLETAEQELVEAVVAISVKYSLHFTELSFLLTKITGYWLRVQLKMQRCPHSKVENGFCANCGSDRRRRQ